MKAFTCCLRFATRKIKTLIFKMNITQFIRYIFPFKAIRSSKIEILAKL